MALCTFLHVCDFYLVQYTVSTEPIQVMVKLRDIQRERERGGKDEVRQESEQELMLQALTEKTPSPLRRGQNRRQEETSGLGNKESCNI